MQALPSTAPSTPPILPPSSGQLTVDDEPLPICGCCLEPRTEWSTDAVDGTGQPLCLDCDRRAAAAFLDFLDDEPDAPPAPRWLDLLVYAVLVAALCWCLTLAGAWGGRRP